MWKEVNAILTISICHMNECLWKTNAKFFQNDLPAELVVKFHATCGLRPIL